MDLRLSSVVVLGCLISVLFVTFADAFVSSTWCEPGDVCLGRGLGLYKNHVIGCECPDELREVHDGEDPVFVPTKCTFDYRRRRYQCKPLIRAERLYINSPGSFQTRLFNAIGASLSLRRRRTYDF